MTRSSSLASLVFLACAASAFASVSVSSPGNGADVTTPFNLSADSSSCSSQPVAAMGYSFDDSTSTTVVHATSINASVSSSTGAHTLHVKSWGDKGASCVTDIALTVSSGSSGHSDPSSGGGGPDIPSDATSVSSIQTLSNWKQQHDGATSGGSSGSMDMVGSPSHNGATRQFVTNYSSGGGELYYVSFGDDTTATNFVYDGWVYLNSSASHIANLEMDMNQVMENGQTVIFGFQCDGYNGTWDYTENAGSPSHPVDHWLHSKAACNPRNWSTDTWHHVQISYSRTSSGTVTYKSVWLDGTEQAINATVNSAFALGWGPTLVTNFQVDGLGSGSTTVYLDTLTVYRW